MKLIIRALLAIFLFASPSWAAFPVVDATAQSAQGSNSTSHPVTIPVCAAGKRLVLFFVMDASDNLGGLSAWTQVGTANLCSGSGCRMEVWWKTSIGTDTLTVTTTASEESSHAVFCISGAHADAPVAGTAATGNSNVPNPPTLSPAWGAADTLFIAVAGVNHDGVGTIDCTAWPANYTGNNITQSSGAAGGVAICTAARSLNAASDDPGTFTTSAANEWVAQTVAIRPAAAAAPRRPIAPIIFQ